MRNDKLAARFRIWAEKMQAQIDDKRRPMTQNPTPKRLKEYNRRLHDANNLERGQRALLTLADLHEAGNVPDCLAELRYKKDILPLVCTSWASDGYYEGHDSGEYWHDSEAARVLQAMIGETVDPRQVKIEQLETKALLNVRQIPGFFPTPKELVKQMLDLAQIVDWDHVLEPSAGSGSIADAVREAHPGISLDVVEIAPLLRELLEAKGHNLVGRDFLEVRGRWDKIVMNPPFERMQDVDHVRHAYGLLAPEGRLVNIVSNSPFFHSSKKAKEFMEWLDDVCYMRIELTPGAFAPYTNVSAHIIVLDKPLDDRLARLEEDFFPTPEYLIPRLLDEVPGEPRTILEPGAGDGRLIDAALER